MVASLPSVVMVARVLELEATAESVMVARVLELEAMAEQLEATAESVMVARVPVVAKILSVLAM